MPSMIETMMATMTRPGPDGSSPLDGLMPKLPCATCLGVLNHTVDSAPKGVTLVGGTLLCEDHARRAAIELHDANATSDETAHAFLALAHGLSAMVGDDPDYRAAVKAQTEGLGL